MSSSTPITFLFVLNFFFFANSMFIDVFQNNNYFCTINTQYSTSCANPSLSASFTLDFPSGNLTYQAIPVSRTSFVFQLLTIPNLSNLIFKGNNSITLDATIGSPASWNDENTVTPIDENTYRICDNMQGCCNARETRQGSQIYSCLSSGCTLLLNLNTNVLKFAMI